MHLFPFVSILLAVSAVTVPLDSRAASCGDVPDDIIEVNDGPTNSNTAGIGAEFETVEFTFGAINCDQANTFAAKKKIINGRTGTNFMLTADTTSEAGRLQAEYIMDGTKIKVGSGDAARAGAAAAADLGAWKPWTVAGATVDVQDSTCNPWTITGPKQDEDPYAMTWQPQVTAPMPLQALYILMKESKLGPESKNTLTGIDRYVGEYLALVTQTYFQTNPNGIEQSQVTTDLLAFCTLVLSYAKGAQAVLIPNQSPKGYTAFMPRTEFNTIFQQVKSQIKGDLFDLFNTLACYKTTKAKNKAGKYALFVSLDRFYCSGTMQNPIPNSEFSDLTYSNSDASVNIKDWIQGIGAQNPSPDLLTTFDRSLDGSIGGLGTAQETMYESQHSVPLFEFRDLDTLPTSLFESFMDEADSATQALHAPYADAPAAKKRQATGACSVSTDPSSTAVSSAANPSVSCVYQDATPENPVACTCVSGTSTTIVQPMKMSSVSVITQSCAYSTWPIIAATVTSPPVTVSTNFAGCQVCTVVGPNEDECSPLPSSLGCTPLQTSTLLSGDTQGVTVGTLTGSALYSAITSGIDRVCQVPPNGNGGPATGSYTCTENATATLASNIRYTDTAKTEGTWDTSGELTLQITEASYDSFIWYSTNKAVLAAYAQNSTQNNCQKITGFSEIAGTANKEGGVSVGSHEGSETFTICKVGSHFQLIEDDPSRSTGQRELSFSLKFQADTDGDIFCQFLEDVVEFIEATVNIETDTEVAIPGEIEVDQKLLDACEGISS